MKPLLQDHGCFGHRCIFVLALSVFSRYLGFRTGCVLLGWRSCLSFSVGKNEQYNSDQVDKDADVGIFHIIRHKTYRKTPGPCRIQIVPISRIKTPRMFNTIFIANLRFANRTLLIHYNTFTHELQSGLVCFLISPSIWITCLTQYWFTIPDMSFHLTNSC